MMKNLNILLIHLGINKMSNYLMDKAKIDNTYFVTNENFEKYNNFIIVSLVVNPGLRNIFQEEKIKDEIGTILLYYYMEENIFKQFHILEKIYYF